MRVVSSRLVCWKMAAPPGVPTPICRFDVVRAAISSSLSARSRRETYFRRNSPIRVDRTFIGSTSCWSYVTLSSGMSVVTSCASVSERIHSSSSNCFVVGPLPFWRKNQLRVEQEAALFQQVSRGPLDRDMSTPLEQAPPLASSCEGDNGIQVFVPFTSRTRSTHWRQLDVGDACFAL